MSGLQKPSNALIVTTERYSQRRRKEYEMFNLENELTLLQQWAYGKHKEDMATFEPKVFHYSKLFEAIRDGATIGQLGADFSAGKYEGLTFAELMGAEGTGAFYYGALGDAQSEQRKRYISKLEAEPEKQAYWVDKITEITNIINSKETKPRCANFADLFIEELTARQNESNPRYGFKQLDRDTEGLHRGQLIVLSARPGCGKSALALQITNNVIDAGYKVMYLPLEMTEYETFQRMIIQQQVVYDSDEAKNPTEEQKADIRSYLMDLERSELFSMYYGLNGIADIEKKITEEQPFLVVVDQLTQVNPVGKPKDIRDKYIQITNTLKRIALNENVCILALHQLNREAAQRNTPSLENLAESDSVGRDADVVLMLKQDEEEDYKELKRTDLVVVKNRQGKVGNKIPLQFHGARYTFCETAPTRYEGFIEEDDRRY